MNTHHATKSPNPISHHNNHWSNWSKGHHCHKNIGTGTASINTHPAIAPVVETPVAAAPVPTPPVAETPVAAPVPQLTIPTPQLAPDVKAITDKGVSVIGVDSDGDGLGVVGSSRGIKFDILNTGNPVNIGWISPNDALLAIDNNGNGTIDNGSELFGGGVGQGFAKLTTFDSNLDGVIDVKDTDFGKLSVWNDVNTNALTDVGELLSLSKAGISSIALNKTTNTFTFNTDNVSGTGNSVLGEKTTALSKDGLLDVVSVYFPV
jgi:hypothetical protein